MIVLECKANFTVTAEVKFSGKLGRQPGEPLFGSCVTNFGTHVLHGPISSGPQSVKTDGQLAVPLCACATCTLSFTIRPQETVLTLTSPSVLKKQ